MADTKISDLAAITDVLATDEYVLARAGTTNKITAFDLAAALGGSGGGGVLYFNKPAGDITRASTSVGAFSTAWQITGVVVAAGQNVLLTMSANSNHSGANNDQLFAFFRDSTQIAARIFAGAQSSDHGGRDFTWIDENPGAGTYTYEIRGAAFTSGTVTVYQTNITTDTGGGNSIFVAEVYTPGGGAAEDVTGWTGAGETWTYASATTFTAPGDLTTKYSAGTRIKLTQTTAKYFVVTNSSHAAGTTTVTITGGTDYTLVSAAITLTYYSYAVNPQGYPGWFNYTPTWSSTSGTPPALVNGTVYGRFSVVGRAVTCQMGVTLGSSSTIGNGSIYTLSLPIGQVTSYGQRAGAAWVLDSGTQEYNGFVGTHDANNVVARVWSATLTNQYVGFNTPFTFASGDQIQLATIYEMA